MSLLHKTRQFTQKLKTSKGPRVVFVHVPKCGGSSIYEAISKGMRLSYPDGHLDPVWSRTLVGELYNYEVPEITKELQVFRHALLAQQLKSERRFIAGHFTVNSVLLAKLKQEYKVVTLLRQPDRRLFSHFKYWMLTRNLAKDADAVRAHWAVYLASDRAKFQANLMATYFGEGYFQDTDDGTVERALSNLHQLDVVGDLGQLKGFEAQLSELLGKAVTVGFANTSNKLMEDAVVNQAFNQLYKDEYQSIQELVRTDTLIYESYFKTQA